MQIYEIGCELYVLLDKIDLLKAWNIICKMKLSQKPVASSGEDALMQLLNSLGGM